MGYVLVLLAVLLLAGQLAVNKVFQTGSGDSLRAGVVFNIFMGLVTAAFFFVVNGFKMDFSLYSLVMGAIMTACSGVYVLLSFRIMALGSVSMYSLFLMLGGMVLPFVYGVAALDEKLNLWRVIGLILICVSMFLTGGGAKKTGFKALALCVIVFFLNGMVSVTSKLHQIETAYRAIGSTDYVILTGLIKAVMFALMLPFTKKPAGGQRALTKKSLAVVALSAVIGGVSYLLQLIGAKTLPATVLYPMVTGGTVVLTSLMGLLFFHEKPGKLGAAGIACCFAATMMFL